MSHAYLTRIHTCSTFSRNKTCFAMLCMCEKNQFNVQMFGPFLSRKLSGIWKVTNAFKLYNFQNKKCMVSYNKIMPIYWYEGYCRYWLNFVYILLMAHKPVCINIFIPDQTSAQRTSDHLLLLSSKQLIGYMPYIDEPCWKRKSDFSFKLLSVIPSVLSPHHPLRGWIWKSPQNLYLQCIWM